MQGKQQFGPKLFETIDYERLIPQSHLLRRIDRVLDLSFIRKLAKKLYCKDNGRRSIDPEVFFRIQLLSFIFGISSDRQLCDEIQVNVAYRWFCGYSMEDAVPDYSSLTRIRDRFGKEIYRKIFEKIVLQCKAAGLVPGKRIIADASMVDADASLDSMIERENSDLKSINLKQHEERYHDFRSGKKTRKISNQTHVSKSDPDCTIAAKIGYRKFSYKAHYSIDSKARVIVDAFVTTGARHECQIFPDRFEYLSKILVIIIV